MRRLELDDLYRIPQVSDPRISPDGSRVAFVVTTADREKDSNRSAIWIVSTDGSDDARPLTTGDNDSISLIDLTAKPPRVVDTIGVLGATAEGLKIATPAGVVLRRSGVHARTRRWPKEAPVGYPL